MGLSKMEKVVFILGAGASHTYGYPLGSGLRYNIIKNYPGQINSYQNVFREDRPDFSSKSLEFIQKFKLSADVSIDLFLSKFPEYEFEGKVAIITSILQAEQTSAFLEDLTDREKTKKEVNDDWMWHLYTKLTRKLNQVKSIFQLDLGDISFVTFNYDRSLEYFLYNSFKNGFNYDKIGGDPKGLMDKITIEHVYGKAVDLPWESKESNSGLEYKLFNTGSKNISNWTKNIRVIYDRVSKSLGNVYNKIKYADKIFFLGFGYDITNLDLLGFPGILSQDQKIFGTAYGLFQEEIDEIKMFFSPAKLHNAPTILNSNCTDLLRRYFLI